MGVFLDGSKSVDSSAGRPKGLGLGLGMGLSSFMVGLKRLGLGVNSFAVGLKKLGAGSRFLKYKTPSVITAMARRHNERMIINFLFTLFHHSER